MARTKVARSGDRTSARRRDVWGVAHFISVWLLIGACSKGGGRDYGKLACLDGWPASPSGTAAAPPLNVSPAVLWQTELNDALPRTPGVALAGGSLVASAGASVVWLDRMTGARQSSQSPGRVNYFFGAPVMDDQAGVLVQSTATLFSFASDGTVRWSVDLANNLLTSEAVQGSYQPILADAGAIVAPSTMAVQGRGLDGGLLWTAAQGVSTTAGHWGFAFDGTASFAVDLRTGKPAGKLVDGKGGDVVTLVPLAGKGILAVGRDNTKGIQLLLLDACGKTAWTLTLPGTGACVVGERTVVGPGEVAYIQTQQCASDASTAAIVAINADGAIVAGPLSIAQGPLAVGADGTVYAADLHAPKVTATFVALSPTLVEQWHLDLQASLPVDTDVAIADDGILYAQLSGGSENSIVAIQTTSPGLASSSWPTYRHDNRGTTWAGGQF